MSVGENTEGADRSAVPPRSGPVAQLGARFHGMEEVVGSIPTRSTKSLNHLQASGAVETAEKPVTIATLMLRDLLRAQNARFASP